MVLVLESTGVLKKQMLWVSEGLPIGDLNQHRTFSFLELPDDSSMYPELKTTVPKYFCVSQTLMGTW